MEESDIKVFCRFRPLNESEERRSLNLCANFISPTTVEIPTNNAENLLFTFDQVFPPTTPQQAIYETAALPIVESVMQGFNGTVFAYGQTSSGKTFTMIGPTASDDASMGIIPRMVTTVFDIIRETPDYMEYSVKVSYCEIYLEKIRDLIDTSLVNLKIHEEKTRGVFIEDLSEHYVSCENEVYELLAMGNENKEVAYTKMNSGSSRSHSLFQLTINQTSLKNYSGKVGKLYLVDLAGSEKVGKTGAAGQRLEEAKNINKSLTALGLVINALTDGKSSHVPYRDSKLTRVLQDSLGGNSKTSLIVTCSPSPYNESETVSTLRFGVRAKTVKNKAKINKEYTIAELKILLSKSQEELDKRASIIAKLEERLKTNDQTISDISFSYRIDDDKIDLDEILAELEDYKQRLSDLAESNLALKEENEDLTAENSWIKSENQKLCLSLKNFEDRAKNNEGEVKDHEELIEKLVMTKENLEGGMDKLMKEKIALEQEVSRKNTEIYQLKQEILFSDKGNLGGQKQRVEGSGVDEKQGNEMLKKQVGQLESIYNSILNASYPELLIKNEDFLRIKLRIEQEKWEHERMDIMKDLENRIQRVIELEIQVDQAKDAYRYLEKNIGKSEKVLTKKNEELEKYIGELSSEYQKEIRLKEKWKFESEYLQKKLIEESKKVERLQSEKNDFQAVKNLLEEKITSLEEINSLKGKGMKALHIKKTVKGGGLVSRAQSIAINSLSIHRQDI